MIRTLTLLFLTTICAYSQFRPNAIGVVYLADESTDIYHLTIVFPMQSLQNSDYQLAGDFKKVIDKFQYAGEMTLFDDAGELMSIKQPAEFRIEFWCENDGGIQYRPTLQTSLKKARFKRKLKGVTEIQNLACFAIVNRTADKVVQPDNPDPNAVRLKGDYNNDGQVDCLLITYESEECEGEPKNRLGMILQLGADQFSLRCCAP
jgi:hypothetical protein